MATPTTVFPIEIRLFDSPSDFVSREDFERNDIENYKIVSERELLKERQVLIIERERQHGQVRVFRKLYELATRESRNNYFIPTFDFNQIYKELRSRLSESTKVFIDNFPIPNNVDRGNSLDQLSELFNTFNNCTFFVATMSHNSIQNVVTFPYNVSLRIAEILIDVDSISLTDDEIQDQIANAEKIEQRQSKAQRRKTKPQQFQPTTTPHDELFRELINSSEFAALREVDEFILEEQRTHYNTLRQFQKEEKDSSTLSDLARALDSKLKASQLSLDEYGTDFTVFDLWKTIVLVVRDVSKAIDFGSTAQDSNIIIPNTYPELERKWASEILQTFIVPGQSVHSPILLNYFSFCENPSGAPYLFEESIKKQIVENLLEKDYQSTQFVPLIWGYFESLGQIPLKNIDNLGYFIASVLLHPKIKSIWNDAQQINQQQTSSSTPLFNNGRVIGQYSPDEASAVDHLDFKHDVHALAALIAYEKTPLPLAIGLFGNWGSGKSSFMKQLQNRVQTLSTEQYENAEVVKSSNGEMPYCSKIAHITFNAWHFSDANLWASMMVHVFDELLKNIGTTDDRDVLRKELLNNLSTAREALKEAEKQLQESTRQKNEAQLALEKVETTKKNIDAELKTVKLSLGDLVSALMKDDQFKSAVKHTAKEIGYNKLVQTKEQLEEFKTEFGSRGQRWKRAIGNLFRGNIQFSFFCLLLIASPLIVGVLYKLNLVQLNANIASIGVSVVTFFGWILAQLKKFDSSLEKIESLQTIAVNKKEAELEAQEAALQEKLKVYEASVVENKKQLDVAIKNEADAQLALDSLDINRQLTSFIQQRQSGNNYQQHLGIISLIRKDFEALSDYLKIGRKEKKNKDRIIDRIVLYIDDLDRCKTERVVAVLEAVHLLLALDLFVVVVGVDPRWVSKALKEQYKEQLHLDATEDSDTSRLPGQRATPFDYLEKIFQVPFVLRSMDNNGAKKLLDNLFKGQVKTTENKSEEAPFEGKLNDPFNTGNPVMKDPFDESNISAEHQEALKKRALEMEEEIQKKKQEEEKKKEFIEQVENLSISEEELTFMKSIAPIIGATPRTVKRYGNLYRLIRVHSDIPSYTAENLEDYQSVMLLLSISVSNGSIARPFFNALKESKKKGFYEVNVELIEKLKEESEAKKKEKQDEELKEKLEALDEQLQALHQLEKTLVKMPAEVKDFSVATLKRYSPVVSRFSFRTLNCVEEEMIQK